MIFQRSLASSIKKTLGGEPRIVVVYGPRQAGKTTIIKALIKELPQFKTVFLNGDDVRVQNGLSEPDLDKIRAFTGNFDLLVIDEAQRIANIGLSIKLLYDAQPRPVLLSGSSSLDLSDRLSEPLTGRASIFTLYPLALEEIPVLPPQSFVSRLEEFLLYGSYPKVHTLEGDEAKQNYLFDVINTYLYKDVLTVSTIRKPKKILDLLSLLALQIGGEVAVAELAQNLALSRPIVEKYLDILEKMFVVVNLRGFSRNLRKEVSKTSKYYFVDLGIRNALINNFNPLKIRSDAGVLFENYCIIEKIKHYYNRRLTPNLYFWRTHDQKELDLIEEKDGRLWAYEFKWSNVRSVAARVAREFSTIYPQSSINTINPENIYNLFTSLVTHPGPVVQ